MNRNYCMIIGDIVGSKKISSGERYRIQEHLKYELEKINFDYDNVICSRFCITLGDELQGGLLSSHVLFKILNRIKRSIEPYKIRFGIGFGLLNTYINYYDAFGTDGPAYYYARKGIEELKKEKTYEYGYRIHSESNDTIIINSLFKTLDILSSSWTQTQKKYISIMEESNGELNKISTHIKVSAPTLSRTLARANYRQIKEIFDNIKAYLYIQYDNAESQDDFIIAYRAACKQYEDSRYLEAVKILTDINIINETDRINCYMLLAMCYTATGENIKALEYAQKSINLINSDFIHRKIKMYNCIGINYTDLKKFNYAKESFENAMSLIDSTPGSRSWYIYTLGNIARLLKNQEEYDNAEILYRQILSTVETTAIDDKATQIRALSNLGNLYIAQKKYKEAYEILDKALNLAEVYLKKDSRSLAIIKLHIGEAIINLPEIEYDEYFDMLEKVYILLNDAIKIFIQNEHKKAIEECYETLIKFCLITGDKLKLHYYTECLSKYTKEELL